MFEHAGQGYAGHGTLCGALGVSSALINLVRLRSQGVHLRRDDRPADLVVCARCDFPTDRFDHLSAIPKQVKAQAMTPLCHTSVTKWTLTAGTEVSSKEKYERCAKVAGEVVYTVVYLPERVLRRTMEAGQMVAVRGDPALHRVPRPGKSTGGIRTA